MIEYSGEWPFPEEFDENEKIDHAVTMMDLVFIIRATHDQLATAREKRNTPDGLYQQAFIDLKTRLDQQTRWYRMHVAAAKPWISPLVLADYDKSLPEEVSRECEELIFNYPTYRQIFH